MGLLDAFSAKPQPQDDAHKLHEAVVWDDALTARQMLLDAGDACKARALANQAHQISNDQKVGIYLGQSGDKETIGVYDSGFTGVHYHGMVASVEFPVCKDPPKPEK